MTIVEMLVTAALVVLFFMFLVAVLIPVMRMWSQNSTRVELQQQGMVAMSRMEADLRATCSNSVAVVAAASPSPAALAFQKSVGGVFTGSSRWQPVLTVYCWLPTTAALLRKTYPPTPPASITSMLSPDYPTACSAADLLQIAVQPNGSELVLSANATAFSVTPLSAGCYRLDLVLQRQSSQSTTMERFDITRVVYLRNNL